MNKPNPVGYALLVILIGMALVRIVGQFFAGHAIRIIDRFRR